MNQRVKRLIVVGIMAASLLVPSGVFAASTGGTTPETLTVASTISATFPAAQTYGGDTAMFIGQPGLPFYETGEGLVTIVGSNNPTGVTITAQASVWDGPGAIEVGTNKRSAAVGSQGSGSGAALTPTLGVQPVGAWATTATVVTLATSTGPLAGRAIGVTYGVSQSNFTVGGEYLSQIAYVASTNP